AALLKPPVPEELRPLVRRAVARFCDSYLPTLELDDDVLLASREVRVARKDVTISWKGKSESTSLTSSGYNEFTLKEELVDRFFVKDRSYEKPIKGTPRSMAVNV